jgi:hypothetical protein
MSGADKIGEAKLNPRAAYAHPRQVLADEALTREQKIEILRAWYYDATRLQESEAEAMSGGEPDMLRAVSNALLQLDVSPAEERDPGAPPKPWWFTAQRYVDRILRRSSRDETKPK